MNALDAGIIVIALAAAFGGWRLGFVARLLAWVGVALALVVGIQFVPRVVTTFGGTSADDRVTVALLFLVLLATLGQAVGLGLSSVMRSRFPKPRGLPAWDRAAGAAIGVLGVLLLVWMTIPSISTANGWPARAARDSVIVAAVDSASPDQPDRFAAWGRSISDAPYPSALGPLDAPPDPGRPPNLAISARVDDRVRPSIVKVSGQACRQIQEGSGVVVAPGVVVTNAHVVAGENATTVEDALGDPHAAVLVGFDPVRDLAILRVSTLDAPALDLGPAEVGDLGAVYGHPGGGPLTVSPARIGEEIVAVGTDIYRTGPSRRQVFVLAAALAPGDSGGALVNTDGDVVGVAFAIDPGDEGTSYALTDTEVRAALDAAGTKRVDAGRCLVG